MADAAKGKEKQRAEALAERYRTRAVAVSVPAALVGLASMLVALRLGFARGNVLSGGLLFLAGLALAGGAYGVAFGDRSHGLRNVALAAIGAVVGAVMLALGLVAGKLTAVWILVGTAVYLVGPALLLDAYCARAAVEAYGQGLRDPEALSRVPRTTFATVERPVIALVEVAALLAGAVLLNYIRVQPGRYKRVDWSALKPGERVYELSPKTKKFLHGLQKDVQVVVFMTPPQSPDQDSIYEDVKELLTRFASETRHLHVEYIDLHRQLARAKALAAKYRLNLADAVDIESGIGGLVVFVCGDKQKYVNAQDMAEYDYQQDASGRFTQKVKAFKAEEAFLNALLNVTQTSPPRVCLTKGHGEPSPDGFGPDEMGYATEMLRREGMFVDTLDKLTKGVPKRCDALVVVGPMTEFLPEERDAVEEYLKGGGRLLYVAQTVQVVGNVPQFAKSGLESVLEKFGIKVDDAFALDLTLRTVQPLIWIAEKTWTKDHPIAKAMKDRRLVLYMPRVIRPLEGKGRKVDVLLRTSEAKNAWGETNLGILMDPHGTIQFDEGKDLRAPVPVAVAARKEGKGGWRVVAFGSVLNFMNRSLDPNRPMQDFSADFLLNALNWLLEREQLVSIAPRVPERIKLELSAKQVSRIFRVTVLGMPLFAMLLGLLVWWVRRD